MVRRDLHLGRLRRTAARFGIEMPDIAEQIDSLSSPDPLRVRLTVNRQGEADLTYQTFDPLPDGTVWRLGLADQRLCATDPWLGVKTTQRRLYDSARAALPAHLDEFVFLNEDGWLCEGTITNLFVDLGDGLLTPPLGCGVLPGVLREELIATGRAREARLDYAALSTCRALFVGNSLRGLIPARLVEGAVQTNA